MTDYFKNLTKIEFAVTSACTGRCKHCSEGEHSQAGERIDPSIAADAVRRISAVYDIKTVLAFGGEPLLYTDAVYSVISAAKEMNIPKRQVITNGYFSTDGEKMQRVAEGLAASGVNDLLVSVDAFHQETIPTRVVKSFVKEAIRCKIPTRLQPAWLVSPDHDNQYNRRTREVLSEFSGLGVTVGEGNVVFPEGNARKYLSEYFLNNNPKNPYIEDPCDVKCISFEPNGDVLGSNVYREDIMKIIKGYTP